MRIFRPFKDQVDPASLGVAYYLAVVNVPAMIAVHILIFIYLLQHPGKFYGQTAPPPTRS
jgi:hypothetical protein